MDTENKLLVNPQNVFTVNNGQLKNDQIRFYTQNGEIWFTDDGVWFEVKEEIEQNNFKSKINSQERVYPLDQLTKLKPPESENYRRVILKQEFVGANKVNPVGMEKANWVSNFFYGNDSSKWCINVPNYFKVFYKNIYDGIDLIYYYNENGLKYDFIINPWANIEQIRLKYYGSKSLKIDKNENLLINTKIKNIMERNLVIYQNHTGKFQQIKGKYKLYNYNEYSFEIIDDYQHNKPLVIDPNIKLGYSTFIGGNGYEYSTGITVDPKGNAIIAGLTSSLDFPITPGANDTSYNGGLYDIFILKLNRNGTAPLYSTFIGGNNNEAIHGDIDLDLNGNVFVTGETNSSNFPITSNSFDNTLNGQFDVFVLKLNHNGSNLIYSTYLGGSDYDRGHSIKVDSEGEIYVTGFTNSFDFPTTSNAYDNIFNGSFDVFVVKVNKSGLDLIYSTFIGGENGEVSYDIDVDINNNAHIVGVTGSINFPTTPGAYDTILDHVEEMFIVKLNEKGSKLSYSTLIDDCFYFSWFDGPSICLDLEGNAIVVGATSSEFYTTPNAYDNSFNGGLCDAFILKININGSEIIFSTYIGGNDLENAEDVIIDHLGNIYITGVTSSSNFPTTPDAYDSSYNGGGAFGDAFILKLSENCSELNYSTYIGGESSDIAAGIALDPLNNIYITGLTNSSDFPNTTGVFDNTYNKGMDVFVQKFSFKPYFYISSVKLLLNSSSTEEIYTRKFVYSFQINITDTLPLYGLQTLRLNLDPLGTNILLLWNRSAGLFLELNDPNDYIKIDSSRNVYNKFDRWTIYFNVSFNWTYPDEELHDVQAYATNAKLSPIWFNATNLFRVENDLVFNGTLLVKDRNNKKIINGSLICGGEKLNWSGLTPVYEGTTDLYPPIDGFDVTLWDESGNSWLDYPNSGQPFNIEMITPKLTYTDEYTYVINLTGIPPQCDKTNVTFTIRIDADNVTFTNPIPENGSWQTKTLVEMGVTITDTGGGEVKGSSVKYIYSTDNSTTWSNWKGISKLKSGTIVKPKDVVFFNEGKDNLIKWQAEDTVGNGPTFSPNYRILVDTQKVSFSNATPNENYESPTTKVEVGITISDTTSGVNASSIEYTVSTDNGNTWGDWVPVIEFNDGNKIEIQQNLTFPNGSTNKIKWRASDIAGNGPTESKAYVIKVNTWLQSLIPRVRLWSPLNGSTIPTNSIKLQWFFENTNLLGVTYDLYFDIIPPIKPNITGLTDLSFKLNDLIDGETYYWMVIPRTDSEEGVCTSGIWSFTVDTSVAFPTVKLLRPQNGSIVSSTKPTFAWAVDYYGTESLSYDVYLDSRPELIYNEESFNPYYLPSTLLQDNLTYYWKVVPKAGSIVGPESETWSFTVKKDHIPHFELELKVEPDGIVMEPGSIKEIKALVTNKGELIDKISLNIEIPSDSNISGTVNEPNILVTNPGDMANFSIMLTTTQNIEPGEVIITVTAISGAASDFGIEYEVELKVKVLVYLEEEPEPEKESEWLYIWGILVIIIIVIVAILLLILIIRKKKAEKIVSEEKLEPPQYSNDSVQEQAQETLSVKELETSLDVNKETSLGISQENNTSPEPELIESPAPIQIQQQDETLEE